MKRNFWCLGNDFTIRDEHGKDSYRVDGRSFIFGEKLSFQDMAGDELACIRQRLLSWGPSYETERPGFPSISAKKQHFTFFTCKFRIDGPGDDDYEASGNFFDHEYEVRGRHGAAATVSKRWFSFTDT